MDQVSQLLPETGLAMTSVSVAGNPPKNHRVEGKNKKSLHYKQQQQNDVNSNGSTSQKKRQQTSQSPNQSSSTNSNNRRANSRNPTNSTKTSNVSISKSDEGVHFCSTLQEFSERAQVLKAEINASLEKQITQQITDQPQEIVELKNDILKLSGYETTDIDGKESVVSIKDSADQVDVDGGEKSSECKQDKSQSVGSNLEKSVKLEQAECTVVYNNLERNESSQTESNNLSRTDLSGSSNTKEKSDVENSAPLAKCSFKSDSSLALALDNLKLQEKTGSSQQKGSKSMSKKRPVPQQMDDHAEVSGAPTSTKSDAISESFEPLEAKLDVDTKYVALMSSLQKHFGEAPQLLAPVCRRLVQMSEQNTQLSMNCEKYQSDNQKLLLVKQKLENLCRELQKSNNAIRMESLDLIKVEQGKAKEQTTKIQSTLSGVIKLFDENQQRNMNLRQENQDLQTKLKSLLDHCDNWEKSVEAALRQRDIENRLLKTELAKADLLKNEEREKFLKEKQELLQILSMMQEQQHRIEGQEAKLRSDLSSYASKYDQCQEVISKGMSRFQIESKRMLKQIEKSKQDYKVLLSKYETTNRKMAQLLEEKQYWDKAINLANKKNETLEKLCRALRERKPEGKSEITGKSGKNKSQKLLKQDVDSQNLKSETETERKNKDLEADNHPTPQDENINPITLEVSPNLNVESSLVNEVGCLSESRNNIETLDESSDNKI